MLSAIPVLLLVTLISASIMQLVPGDPAMVIAGSNASDAEIQQVRRALGLDRSFGVRLLEWYGGMLRGDLGQSLLLNRSVTDAILERLPVTLALAGWRAPWTRCQTCSGAAATSKTRSVCVRIPEGCRLRRRTVFDLTRLEAQARQQRFHHALEIVEIHFLVGGVRAVEIPVSYTHLTLPTSDLV